MKVIKIKNLNGKTEFLVQEFLGIKGNFFRPTSNFLVTAKNRCFLNYVPADIKNTNYYGVMKTSKTLQYDGSKAVANEQGYMTVGAVLKVLMSDYSNVFNSDYNPYVLHDYRDPISFAELGYLLTYACRGSEDFPPLGKYSPSDPKMKISVISVNDYYGNKVPEFRLGEYKSESSFTKYRKSIEYSLRPVPLPLFYGYEEVFGDYRGASLLGEVPRGVAFSVIRSSLGNIGR